MIVYHGSVEAIETPDVLHSHRPLDFGKGFDQMLVFHSFEGV